MLSWMASKSIAIYPESLRLFTVSVGKIDLFWPSKGSMTGASSARRSIPTQSKLFRARKSGLSPRPAFKLWQWGKSARANSIFSNNRTRVFGVHLVDAAIVQINWYARQKDHCGRQ